MVLYRARTFGKKKGDPYVCKFMKLYKTIFLLLVINIFILNNCFANEADDLNQTLLKGYITNKKFLPIKLKISDFDKNSFYIAERNLEDNSIEPYVDLMINAYINDDYSLKYGDTNIFIPKSTKFEGRITEIVPAKTFNRKGFYRVTFDKVTCPDNSEVVLKSIIVSRSKIKTYSPANHFGKTVVNALGGAALGTLFSYQLGGLGLIAATHGYSLAAGAGAGGLVGTIIGVASKGKSATLEPGDSLNIIPIGDAGLAELQQFSCMQTLAENKLENTKLSDVKLDILSVKKKRNDFGENAFKITFKFENNSKEIYKLSDFTLKDSQGKEYMPTFLDFKGDFFEKFPPNQIKTSFVEFAVEHPKADHWLILKEKGFNKEIGRWSLSYKG